MTGWVRAIRLGLAAIFGIAVGVEGIYTTQTRSPGQEGYGVIFGVGLSLVGLLIFYSQVRYENKLGRAARGTGLDKSDTLGSRLLIGIGAFLSGLGHWALAASALYLIAIVFRGFSGGDVSGIPLVAGLFGGAICYLLGDAFKKSV